MRRRYAAFILVPRHRNRAAELFVSPPISILLRGIHFSAATSKRRLPLISLSFIGSRKDAVVRKRFFKAAQHLSRLTATGLEILEPLRGLKIAEGRSNSLLVSPRDSETPAPKSLL